MSATNPAKVISRTSHLVAGEEIWIELTGCDKLIYAIEIDHKQGRLARKGKIKPTTKLAKDAVAKIQSYFKDPVTKLKLPLFKHQELPNQKAAMDFLVAIPCGETRSYTEQSKAVRKSQKNGFTARNAGNANHKNHYPLVIPCHRIIRSNGELGGFMGSTKDDALRLKNALIANEKATLAS